MIALMALSVPAAAQAQIFQGRIDELKARTMLVESAIAQAGAGEDRSCGALRPAESQATSNADYVATASEWQSKPGLSDTTYWRLGKVVREGAPLVARGLLDVAGAYQRWGCKDDAKRVYLQVISTFTGSNYAAYRELASEGLADLRAGN